MNLKTRKDYYNVECNIEPKYIYRSSKLIQTITGIPVAPTKSIVGDNAFAHEAGIHQHGVLVNRSTYEIMSPQDIGIPENKIVLGKHSGKHAFEDRLKELGYSLNTKELKKAFDRFKILAYKKKIISDKDLDALIAMKLDPAEQYYKLENFVINSGSKITSTATVSLQAGLKRAEVVACGDGPVDASYKAINDIIEKKILLDDYSINATTEGEDALGEVIVKVSFNEHKAVGRAVSTDIIEASILAYLNGINKL